MIARCLCDDRLMIAHSSDGRLRRTTRTPTRTSPEDDKGLDDDDLATTATTRRRRRRHRGLRLDESGISTRQRVISSTSDDVNESRWEEGTKAGEVVHIPPGCQVCALLFFSNILLIGTTTMVTTTAPDADGARGHRHPRRRSIGCAVPMATATRTTDEDDRRPTDRRRGG